MVSYISSRREVQCIVVVQCCGDGGLVQQVEYGEGGVGVIQCVEVQVWCVVFEQVLVQFGDYLCVEFGDCFGVVVVCLYVFGDLVWDFCVVGVGEVFELVEIVYWYDFWNDWYCDVECVYVVDEMEICVGVEEILCDCVVCVCFDFGLEVVQVGQCVFGLWVGFWIGCYFDVEVVV